jgi:VanZ family protein
VERKHLVLGLLIIYVVVLFVGAIISIPSNLEIVSKNDKLIHFFEFLILAVLLLKTMQAFNVKHIYLISVVLGLVFMILSESVQTFAPDRVFSYYDLLADVAGFIVGVGVFKWIFFKL